MQFPVARVAEEKLVSSKVTTTLLVTFVGLGVCLVFVAWIAEYLLVGTVLAHWVAVRWYIPVAVAIIILIGQRAASYRRFRALQDFFHLSVPIDEYPGLRPNTKFQTGGVRIDGKVVGPITIGVDQAGISIWKLGAIRAYFPWSDLSKVVVRTTDEGNQSVEGEVRRGVANLPTTFVLPWDKAMTRYIPVDKKKMAR